MERERQLNKVVQRHMVLTKDNIHHVLTGPYNYLQLPDIHFLPLIQLPVPARFYIGDAIYQVVKGRC